MGGAAATEPPSVSLSFANNFWGKDDAGVGPMLDRMHAAKVTNDELKNFYAARAAIEDEYARKLLSLSRKPLGSCETGTLRLSCDVVKAEVESMGKAHQSIAQQMKTELEEPLAAFAGGMKERRKIVQNGIEKLLKLKMQQTSTVNKARDRYEQDCLKIKGFLAQAHMVMGHEERKNKARLEKTQINLSTTSAEYEAAVKVLEETTGRWNRDWKAACDKFQDLEEERIDYTKSSLWNFANVASTVCVSDDASCEKMRLSLEDCDVEKDITGFIADSGTGQEIPDAPKFINFCRGDAETASQTSEDDNYSVAQFARTMNPAYRASSPQPSVFESHHDPNNPLARELGLQRDTHPVPQDQINMAPQQDQIEVPSPRPAEPSHPIQAPQPVDYAQPVRHAQSTRAQREAQPIQTQQPMQSHRDLQQNQSPRDMHPTRDVQPIPSQPDVQPVQSPRDMQPMRPQRERAYSQRERAYSQRERAYSQRDMQPPPLQREMQPPQSPREIQPLQSQRNVQPPQPQRGVQPDPRLVQAQEQARQNYQQSQIPHNDYPADGMTQFCRIGPPSDRSTIPSPARPVSRDSQSEYSNPTSFESIEPPSGSASPGKPMPLSSFAEPSPITPIEENTVAKKRGFFNSPFAPRRSKQEEKPPVLTPTTRNTWGPTRRQTDENVSPTKSSYSRGTRGTMLQDAPRSASPEPIDPRANFQLNVGNNVFDVASPDKKKLQQQKDKEPEAELDPIAQALEELKGVTKQPSGRQTADRYHGLATPAPPATPALGANVPGSAPTPLANMSLNAAKRGTPPPYEQPPMSRLGAPKPAHTARQMQKTTQMYVSQKSNMFNNGESTRSSSRSPTKQEPPRAASPQPPRAVSPRPSLYKAQQPTQNSYRSTQQQPASPSAYQPAQRQQQQQQAPPAQRQQAPPAQRQQPPPQQQQRPPAAQLQRPPSAARQQSQPQPQQQPQAPSAASSYNRNASPNPYAAASNTAPRPRAQTATAPAQTYGTPIGRNSYTSTRGASPSIRAPSPQPPQPAFVQPQSSSRPQSRAAPSSRAVSPQPAFRQSFDDRPSSAHRPSSSRSNNMSLALSTAGSEGGDGSVYGGSVRGRAGTAPRPQSSYYAGGSGGSMYNGGSGSSVRAESRARSKSLAEPKNYNSQGREILNYSRAMYSYAAQIPEELGFQKGDILAVLRLQDDGWWEAEAVGKHGRPGLVPSNYLQPC